MAYMSAEAREARNKYRRWYYKNNAERIRKQQEQYWKRKAAKMAEEKITGGAINSEQTPPLETSPAPSEKE